MDIPITKEVIPFFFGALAIFGLIGLVCRKILKRRKTAVVCYLLAVVSACYMLYFFRDPDRTVPNDPSVIVAGADGIVTSVRDIRENKFLNTDTVRISIFLSLLDVHVNRAPLSGRSTFMGYYPGKRFFTLQEKSSEYNQHNSIVIEGDQTRCLIKQIVGPVARRVVYWLDKDHDQEVAMGERIGMMKFGSRLDMYLPKSDVTVIAVPGNRVTAGVTIVATIKKKE